MPEYFNRTTGPAGTFAIARTGECGSEVYEVVRMEGNRQVGAALSTHRGYPAGWNQARDAIVRIANTAPAIKVVAPEAGIEPSRAARMARVAARKASELVPV